MKSNLMPKMLVSIPAILAMLSGIAKLVGVQQAVHALKMAGVEQYIPILGCAEIGFAILFLYAPTRRVGFLLMACYFSGALATELSHGNSILAPAVILVLVFIAGFARDRAVFFPGAVGEFEEDKENSEVLA